MKKIQILYIVILTSFSCISQSNVPSNARDIMISNVWIIDGYEDGDVYEIKFTNTKMSIIMNGFFIGEHNYYLSDNLGDCRQNGFNKDRVANSAKGNYIIAEKSCFELLVVNNTELKFKSLGSDQSIITVAHSN